MYIKTIFHTLTTGENVKFTINDRIIEDKIYYYANVININLATYKKRSEMEQNRIIGIEISDGKNNKINYLNLEELENDLLRKYGNEWLITQK